MRQWERVSDAFARVSSAADAVTPGPERVRAHAEALRRAQQYGSFAEEFVARLDLTEALLDVPRDPRDLEHAEWLKGSLHPDRGLDQTDRDAVLWRLTWAVDLAEDTPEVDLGALVAAVDAVEEALSSDGHPLRHVHAARARIARDTGDRAGMVHHLAAWQAEPRDDGLDCPACEHRDQAHLLSADDPGGALALLAPVVRGELSCEEEPRGSLGLDAYLRVAQGDVDAAVSSFRRAWPLVHDDPTASRTLGWCLLVLLRLGNADRAVDLLLPRLEWLEDLPTARARMWFAATGAHVLDRAAAAHLAPDEVAGEPLPALVARLRGTADELAAAFDRRYGSRVTSTDLAAAHDPALVLPDPTLPPTRLPRVAVDATRPLPHVHPGAGVVERAAELEAGIAAVATDLDALVQAWLRDRTALLPVGAPQEWSAVSLLDRVSAQDAGPDRHRELLESALEAAVKADDEAAALRCEGELALLDVAAGTTHDPATGRPVFDATAREGRGRARRRAAQLDAIGADAEAGGLWRRIAWFGAPDHPVACLERAAGAHGRAGQPDRRLLCLSDAAAARARLEAIEPHVADHPVLRSMTLELRGRIARESGDHREAATQLHRAVAVRGIAERSRLTLLLTLCDVLVDLGDWDALEGPAADLVAASTRLQDPVLLAYGQRFLGLAYVETGRPAEAAELLEPALAVLRTHGPGLVAPAAWALGNALTLLERWEDARTAFATASAAFAAQGRTAENAHAQWRAALAAMEAGNPDAAGHHLDAAVRGSRSAGAVSLHVEALRGRAALRAEAGELQGGIAELDSAIAAGEQLAARVGAGEEEFDPEVLEPDVLRQGAHLLARHGHVDAAVERLRRAEALVGAELELVLRTEAGIVLADADRLGEAEPCLRASLEELQAAGLTDERVAAAGALALALDRSGRGEEAERVWQGWGPDA
jgi:tetratricopeptide (TPR) repeat protein